MKTIYLDSDFRCHLSNDGTMVAAETSIFDGMANDVIEMFHFVPEGETWLLPDGSKRYGEYCCSFVDRQKRDVAQAISYLDDDQAESVTALFKQWESGTAYAVGDRRQYDGLLYRCVQAHTSQDDWTPPAVPALWVRTWTDEYPEWIQPTGAHDAYNTGDKVSHNGKHWISTIDANTYEPGVYGWDEVT